MCSPNINWAGNSLLSCRGCNRKRKKLLVSISLDFDGCTNFLSHEKTLHPKKSTVWKGVVSLVPLGVQPHPVFLVISVKLELVESIFRAEGASLLWRSQARAHRELLALRRVGEGFGQDLFVLQFLS